MPNAIRRFHLFAIITVAALPLISWQAYAREQTDESSETPANSSGMDITPDGTFHVRMVSGGIGEEMDMIKSVEKQYDLKILFTGAGGEYLSDVQVSITDTKGQVVAENTTKGPILLVNLPTGTYKVSATANGETKVEKVTVHLKSLRSTQLRFHGAE
jgi:hypothetical protein